MNKFHILILLSILLVFGGIIYITQKDAFNTPDSALNQTPSLPPEDELEFISRAPANDQQAQQQQDQQANVQGGAVQGPVNASVSAIIKTSKGDISVILFGKEAPNIVANFINKSKGGFYKNLTFHRVEDWVIQGGDPKGNGTGGGQILAEQSAKPFLTGSLGVARGADARINNDSQFFITKTDADWLNGQYTNFGMVTSGMNVVNNIKIGDKILGITVE